MVLNLVVVNGPGMVILSNQLSPLASWSRVVTIQMEIKQNAGAILKPDLERSLALNVIDVIPLLWME
jgi:hypothetical protein